MLEVRNFQVQSQLYRSATTQVVRATRDAGGAAVVLKIASEVPDIEEVARGYHHEFELLQSLGEVPVVRAHEFVRDGRGVMLVLEDLAWGRSLREQLRGKALPLVGHSISACASLRP